MRVDWRDASMIIAGIHVPAVVDSSTNKLRCRREKDAGYINRRRSAISGALPILTVGLH
jgi:hypothetical protein